MTVFPRPAAPAPSRLPMHAWAPADRPRERLRGLGPGALSNRELLSILIGSGGPHRSALDIATAILARADGNLRRLASLPPAALAAEPGVGPATVARIQGALELGRRVSAGTSDLDKRIQGPRDVFLRMGPLLQDLKQEEFRALLLNTQHRVLRDVLVTKGILDASLIHPREVFRAAIVESAAGVILVHNHPSGDPSPSQEDRTVTRQLAEAGRAVGIPVLDHIIVGEGRFVSLSDELRVT